MYNVTETFLEKVTENSRVISGKLYLGDLELTDEDLITMDMEYSLGNDSIPVIGGVVSSRLNVKLFRDKLPPVLTTQELKPYLGLEISKGNIEYIPMGKFRINPKDTVKTDKTVSLVGYDILFILEDSPYESSLTFPTTWNIIKTELETKGLKFKNQALASVTIKEKPNTIRELLSNVAELLGMNVVTNRLGEIEFRQLNTTTFVTDNYNSFKLLADDEVKLTRLTVEKEEEELTYGNDTGFTIKVKNDSITTVGELTTVYNRIFPISYIAYECNLQGLPHLDVGDIIKLIDRHGVERNIPIAYHKISYSGGLRSEIRANAPDGAISSTGSTGSRTITQSLNDMRVNILEVNHILADKADISLVVANEGRINDLYAVKANISDLQATNARIDVLEVGYADISVLEADVARINTLLAGNLDATNMKAGFITADSGLIANLAITNAMIANLDASKINTGYINTNNVTVRSEEGNLRIENNTLKVWDNEGKERVSLGLNDTDYNLLIRGKDGQTVLFGTDGVTNAGITEGAVDDSKVSPNANIDGSKLNIGSVVQEINNGVTKIESSHINYDGKSLNVAFGELESGLEERVKITDFQIEQGRINTLISDVSTIEGEVNSTKSRVSTIEQTVGTIQTNISDLETDVDTTKSNLSQLTQDVNSFKTTVSETYATKKELSTKESEIKQYADSVGISVINTVSQNYETIENVNQKINTAKGEIKVTTDEISSRVSNVENTINTITPHSIILSNENQSFVTDSKGDLPNRSEGITIGTDIGTYKGVNRINATIDSVIVKTDKGNIIKGWATIINPTSTEDGRAAVRFNKVNHNYLFEDVDGGTMEIYLTIEGKTYVKVVTWNKAKMGAKGEDGTPGQNAKLVKIIPSNLYFIRDKNGVAPNNITLTPNFQNTTYQNWHYSTNGTTWTSITRTSSSTLYPWMNSTTRVLTIPKNWSVLNNNDYVVFRITTTTGETDVQTISILYDVSEIESRLSTAEQKIIPSAIINTVQQEVSKGGTTIAQKSDITQTMDEWVAKFDYLKAPVPFRYVRSSMQEINGAAWWREIEVLANGINVALGRTVTSNRVPASGFNLSYYTDGDTGLDSGVLFTGIPSGGWVYLQVDLGQVYDNIDSVIDYIGWSDGTQYNYKLEVSEDGTNWHTIFDGVRNTSVNSFGLSGFQQGITTINADGVKVEHSDISGWSMVSADGFKRKWQYGEAKYLNDIYVEEFRISPGFASDSPPPLFTVQLPQSFRNRNGRVKFFLSLSGFDIDLYADDLDYAVVTLEVASYNLNTSLPYVDVRGYVENVSHNSLYSGLDFLILAIGY